MPESSLEVKDIRRSSVECRTTPLWQFGQSSLPLHKNSYMQSTFCTENNVQECLSHISQEVSSLGLAPVWTESGGSSELNVVAVLNCMYDLIQLHHRGLRTLENMEVEQLKSSSNLDYLQLTSTRLKEQLELSKRENTGLLERERQLQLKVKSLQNCLKNEKEEVQKLQNIIASRASQYNHEMKRKEREFNKLKERLNQLLVDKKERKQGMRADSEEEEEVFDSSKESVDLFCVHAREKLTNSIRLQWRRLKSHVERLDSQASLAQMGQSKNTDAVSRETHEEEMDRLKLEIQQCKDFIQTQQQLLQQQLSSPCDEETASLLNDCYMLQEKDRLREDWKTLEDQRKNFERERRNFTEAAIRLSHERKAFEEDRAMWLKHQFLNLSPFADSKKPKMSKSKSAFQISASEQNTASAPEKLVNFPSDTSSPASRHVPLTSSSTANLYRTLCLIPENSSTKPKTKAENADELSIFCNGNVPVQQHEQWSDSEDHSGHTFAREKNSSI
ncbi:hypothetical protein PAMP_024105 [Pampus punctatissimus]